MSGCLGPRGEKGQVEGLQRGTRKLWGFGGDGYVILIMVMIC